MYTANKPACDHELSGVMCWCLKGIGFLSLFCAASYKSRNAKRNETKRNETKPETTPSFAHAQTSKLSSCAFCSKMSLSKFPSSSSSDLSDLELLLSTVKRKRARKRLFSQAQRKYYLPSTTSSTPVSLFV